MLIKQDHTKDEKFKPVFKTEKTETLIVCLRLLLWMLKLNWMRVKR